MVDWDRVEQLHTKGLSWEEIAADPKVGFHPDQSVSQAGPALRRLYYRRKSRTERQPVEEPKVKRTDPRSDKRWTLARIGYLLVPLVAIWFTVAYLVPSPVGLILAAIPYIAIILAVAIFILAFGLLRSTVRWSKVFRTTLVLGVVLGLVFVGLISVVGLLSGCPFLPPASSGKQQPGPGWISVGVPAWQQGGSPVLYFYGATWCPYCSASSWAIWKALTGFGTVTGTSLQYSAEDNIPEINMANAQVSSSSVAFVITYDTSGVTGTFPGTANCVQQAYVSAYSGSAIPFVVINGQYVHGGSTLIQPSQFSGQNVNTVYSQVQGASGAAWTAVQGQTWWMMAFIAKSGGATPSNLASQPYYSGWAGSNWGGNTQSNVASDLSQIV